MSEGRRTICGIQDSAVVPGAHDGPFIDSGTRRWGYWPTIANRRSLPANYFGRLVVPDTLRCAGRVFLLLFVFVSCPGDLGGVVSDGSHMRPADRTSASVLSNGVAARRSPVRYDQKGLGPTEAHSGGGWSLWNPGHDCRGYREVTHFAGPQRSSGTLSDAGGVPAQTVCFAAADANLLLFWPIHLLCCLISLRLHLLWGGWGCNLTVVAFWLSVCVFEYGRGRPSLPVPVPATPLTIFAAKTALYIE